MKDLLPDEISAVQHVESICRDVFEAFGFSEIRIPLLELTEVFARSIGSSTDIVEKEMYTFRDRDGKSLSLRPEGTASVVRAYIEHQLYHSKPIAKLYYLGAMFRYERPQAGRFRQFYQTGIEALGSGNPLLDVDVLAVLTEVIKRLKIPQTVLEINSLGDSACRPQYQLTLKTFLSERLTDLCDDCQRRFETNPLRVLDCKKEPCRSLTAKAPSSLDYLCQSCREHFNEVQQGLKHLKIPFKINERLVRGLDYYTRTAFEVSAPGLGAQNAICAGGRYDGLVEALGGPDTPGIGFAMGVERMASLVKDMESAKPDVFFALLGQEALKGMLPAIMQLRREGLKTEFDYAQGNLKKQMSASDRLGAAYTLIVGEHELKSGIAILRNMKTKEQHEIHLSSLTRDLISRIKPQDSS